MKKKILSYSLLVGIAGLIVGLDQWTKALIRLNIPFGGSWTPWDWLQPYARFVHWNNTGAAFGLFQEFGGVFTILAILISGFIVYYYPRVPEDEWYLKVAMGMQLGGALGNLVDRLVRGVVTDFISVGDFAVFNIADASITLGVVVLLAGIWFKDKGMKLKPEEEAAAEIVNKGQSIE